MDLTKYASARRFIRLADVQNGPKRKIIASIGEGDYDKPVATFTDGTKISLNKTNVSALIDLFGSADSKYVVGKVVELYAGNVRFQGDDKPSVLLRAVPDIDDLEETKVTEPPKDHPAMAAPFNDEIPEF
jgi:hypothetical protein